MLRTLRHRSGWVPVAALLLLGAAARLYRIDHQSVWCDEAFSVYAASLPLPAMNERLVRDFVQPPLHYYLLHVWFEVTGVGIFQARLLAALFGILSLPLLFAVARRLLDRRTAVLATLLLALSQFAVQYSQEARPYSQYLFLFLAALWLFLEAIESGRPVAWWLFVGCAALLLYTHYFSAVALAVLVLFAWVYRKRYPVPWTRWAGAACFLAAACVPWLTSGVIDAARRSGKIARVARLIGAHWYSAVGGLHWFNSGKIQGVQVPSPPWAILAGGLLFTLPALWALKPILSCRERSEPKQRMALLLLASLTALPLAGSSALAFLDVQYHVRYIIFALAPYLVLVARGIATIPSPWLSRAALASALCWSLLALRPLYFQTYKEDYRSPLAYLNANYRGGDCCVSAPRHWDGRMPYYWHSYYSRRPEPRVLRFGEIDSWRGGCGRIWLVWDVPWYLNRRGGNVEEIKRKLESFATLADQYRTDGLEISLFLPSAPHGKEPPR